MSGTEFWPWGAVLLAVAVLFAAAGYGIAVAVGITLAAIWLTQPGRQRDDRP